MNCPARDRTGNYPSPHILEIRSYPRHSQSRDFTSTSSLARTWMGVCHGSRACYLTPMQGPMVPVLPRPVRVSRRSQAGVV